MRVAFYFPYPSVGGVSILFLRSAEYLAKVHEVYVVDIEDGYMARNCPTGCRIVDYRRLRELPEDTTIITQSCPLWRIPYIDELPSSTKIVFWNLHPNNLNPLIFPNRLNFSISSFISYFRKKKIKKMVQLFSSRNSIFFMDSENRVNTENKVGIVFKDPIYMPIFNSVELVEQIKYQNPAENSVIKCIAIGRITGFKVAILSHLIYRLDCISDVRIHLTIVGQGEKTQLILEQLRSCKRITYEHLPELHFSELKKAISSNDVAFSMGTSALDSACIGIPTVCLDYSYSDIGADKLYRFYFMYERSGYDLGCEIKSTDFEKSDSLGVLLKSLYNEGEIIANKTYDYYLNNHSHNNLNKLERLIERSDLYVKELLNHKLNIEDVVTNWLVFALFKNKIDDSGFVKF